MNSVVNIHEAKTHLSRLIERARAGEEITIAKAGEPVAKLVPVTHMPRRCEPGSAKGEAWISDDFNAPLPDDIQAAFE